jgi:hypothetical protein
LAITTTPRSRDLVKCLRASFTTILGICLAKELGTLNVMKMTLPSPWIKGPYGGNLR